MQNGSPAFSFDTNDLMHVGIAFAAFLGACAISFGLVVLPMFQFNGSAALIVLVLTPVLHAVLLWLKSNDTGNPAKPLIDALPGRTAA